MEWQEKLKHFPQVAFESNRFGPLLFAFVVGAAGLYYLFGSFAATPAAKDAETVANLTLEPTANYLASGDSLTMRVWADSLQQTINVVNTQLKFPADTFEFVSADTSGTGFDQGQVDTSESSAGYVGLTRATASGVSGRQLVATLILRAKDKTGAGDILLSKDSSLLRSTDRSNILQKTVPATYTITGPNSKP